MAKLNGRSGLFLVSSGLELMLGPEIDFAEDSFGALYGGGNQGPIYGSGCITGW